MNVSAPVAQEAPLHFGPSDWWTGSLRNDAQYFTHDESSSSGNSVPNLLGNLFHTSFDLWSAFDESQFTASL